MKTLAALLCALILAGCIPQELRNDPTETYARPPNGAM
jgi:ABC-type uncharacterized transport system auxiliary subunit